MKNVLNSCTLMTWGYTQPECNPRLHPINRRARRGFLYSIVMLMSKPQISKPMPNYFSVPFKPRSILGWTISLLMWQPQVWADTAPVPTLPQMTSDEAARVAQEGLAVINNSTDGLQQTIKQQQDKIILNWESFNIGEGHSVNFQQAQNAVALNRVLDSTAPSQLLGALNATGSVYLINQSGILFGKNSQTHVGNLIASTLDVSDERFTKTSINDAINHGEAALLANPGPPGTILIEKGAQISTESGGSVLVVAPEIANAGEIRTPDGQTVLAAATDKVYLTVSDKDNDLRGVFVEVGTGGSVDNLGEIVAERGNVTLMGLAVNQAGRVRATSSVDVNGTIRLLARDGAKAEQTTIDDKNSPRLGIDSVLETPTTQGKYALATNVGQLTLGKNSLTQVSPEQPAQAVLLQAGDISDTELFAKLISAPGSKPLSLNDTSGHAFNGFAVDPATYVQLTQALAKAPTLVRVLSAEGQIAQVAAARVTGSTAPDAATRNADGSLKNPSKIALYANNIQLAENAVVRATAGQIDAIATNHGADPVSQVAKSGTGGHIGLASGALLDVAGAEVELDPASQVVEVELRGSELQNSPLQRDGILRGKTIHVDMRQGTKMADISGAVAKVKRGIDELSTQGGKIQLYAEGDVTVAAAAKLNIQGGSIHYTEGEIATTQLLKDGKLVDISKADPNVIYDGIATGKAGVDQLPAFDQGQNAGSLLITTRKLDLRGSITGGAQVGDLQRTLASMPYHGKVTIDLDYFNANFGQNVWLGTSLPSGHNMDAWLTPEQINNAKVTEFSLTARGAAEMAQDAQLQLVPGAQFSLAAQDLIIGGQITAAGGAINLVADVSAFRTQDSASTEETQANRSVWLKNTARLNTSGNWVNDYAALNSGEPAGEVSALNGGTLSLSARGTLRLDTGFSLAANAGASYGPAQNLNLGKGGSISLKTAMELTPATPSTDGGLLLVDADGLRKGLSSWGFTQDGQLKVTANSIQVGTGKTTQALLNPFVLDDALLAQAGFSAYSLFANRGGVEVVGHPDAYNFRQRNWVFAPGAQYTQAPSGAPLDSLTQASWLPDPLRKPVNLTLSQGRPLNPQRNVDTSGWVSIDPGATLNFDPGATININTNTRLYMDGVFNAPAGKVDLQLNALNALAGFDAHKALWLGAHAQFNLGGTVVWSPDTNELKLGKLWDGGNLGLHAINGYLISEAGARVDLSAADATLDVPAASGYQREHLASNAGTLTLDVGEGLIWQGAVTANSFRNLGASGATLQVNLLTDDEAGHTFLNEGKYPENPRGIDIYAQNQVDLLSGLAFGDALPNFLQDDNEQLQLLNGRAILFADQLKRWDLDQVSLNTQNWNLSYSTNKRDTPAEIVFKDSLDLTAARQVELDALDIRVESNSTVKVAAPKIILGEANGDDKANRFPSGPATGQGLLSLAAEQLELTGNSRVSGVQDLYLLSEGDLLVHGQLPAQDRPEGASQLRTSGNITLKANTLYPGTLSDFTFQAGDTLNILAGQAAPSTVLTAGGALHLKARQVNIDGNITAPFGNIDVQATSLHLGSTAQLNVSGNGELIPFGQILGNDEYWSYQTTSDAASRQIYNQPPEKRVTLTADSVVMDKGSQVNLSGGGDLLAYQFTPGPGGAKDVLRNDLDGGAFAVIPKGHVAAYDLSLMSDSGYASNDTITLAASPGLAAGEYQVLPARYAILPGAFLITPTNKPAFADSLQNTTSGAFEVAGRLSVANTQIHSPNWSTFKVDASTTKASSQQAAAPNQLANYYLRTANAFFGAKPTADPAALGNSSFLPQDAGSLALSATKSLDLSGSITGEVATGARGTRVEIVGTDIRVVHQRDAQQGLQLLDDELSNLKADSVLLGAQRDTRSSDHALIVTANTVKLEDKVKVVLPELILAAKDQITLAKGASLTAQGTSNQVDTSLTLKGDGAILRASAAGQSHLERQGTEGKKGSVVLEEGSTVSASHSLLLDASLNTRINGKLNLAQGSLYLSGQRMQLGGPAPTEADTLFFNADFFKSLNLDELILQGRQQIALGADLNLRGKNLQLQTAQLTTATPDAVGTSHIEATETLRLRGSNNLAPTTPSLGIQGLTLSAKQLVIGAAATPSQMAVQGFGATQFNATQLITGEGTSQLTASGNLSLQTPLVTVGTRGNLAITAAGDLKVQATGPATDSSQSGLGGRLSLSGNKLEQAGNLVVKSGQILLNATDTLNLSANSRTDVAGGNLAFGDTAVGAPGGLIALTSHGQQLTVEQGAALAFGGGSLAKAGELRLTANQGELSFNALLTAGHKTGDTSGRISIDALRIANSDALFTALGASGATESLSVRLRSGHLTFGAGMNFQARNLDFSSDQGAITLAGNLKAQSETGAGGTLRLQAKQNILLTGKALLDASSTQAQQAGGTILLASTEGNIQAGSGTRLITTAKDADQAQGRITLRASEPGMNNSQLASQLKTGKVDLQIAKAVELANGNINQTDLDALLASTQALFQNTQALQTRVLGSTNTPSQVSLAGEFWAPGDVKLTSDLDLSQWRFGPQQSAGLFSLGAGGNLHIDYAISDGFTADTTAWGKLFADANGKPLAALMSGQSTSLQLVSGADLNAANRLAVNQGMGDLLMAQGTRVRTGTGSIDIATGRNLDMQQGEVADAAIGGTATIYTAGLTRLKQYDNFQTDANGQATQEWLPDYGSVNPYYAPINAGQIFLGKVYYPEQGGNISINTGGDILGSNSKQLFTEWLHRLGGKFLLDVDPVTLLGQERNITTWGIAYDDFNQGIGAFGGGNINISSHGNIQNLSVVAPNTGKAMGEGLQNAVAIQDAGQVTITSEGDVIAPRLLAASKQFALTSGGDISAAVLGLSDAQLNVTATGNLTLNALVNPSALPLSATQTLGESGVSDIIANYFYSYGQNTQLHLTSLGGTLRLENSQDLQDNSYIADTTHVNAYGFNLFPGEFTASALTGDITIAQSMAFYPTADGSFQLFAGQNVIADLGKKHLFQAYFTPDELGTPNAPLSDATVMRNYLSNQLDQGQETATFIPPFLSKALHEQDFNPSRIVANTGKIANLYVDAAESVDLRAGTDIEDLNVIIQHTNAAQASSIRAGRDIRFTQTLNNGTLSNVDKGIYISGPGSLRVEAGHNIELGTSEGIQAIGQGISVDSKTDLRRYNSSLEDRAADLYLLAGVNRQPDYTAFANRYVNPAPDAQVGTKTFIDLVSSSVLADSFIARVNQALSDAKADTTAKNLAEARDLFAKLPRLAQQQIALAEVRLPSHNCTRELMAWVTSDQYNAQKLPALVGAVTGKTYGAPQQALEDLAALPIAQQHSVGLEALKVAPLIQQKNFLESIAMSEIRKGGEAAIRNNLKLTDAEGYERGYQALSTLFPGMSATQNPWDGSVRMDNSTIKTLAQANMNLLVPGGNIEVGLPSPTSTKNLSTLGFIVGSYGELNAAASNNINVNSSRIFNQGGGDLMLWSSWGDIDAGKGSKSALNLPPPKVVVDSAGNPKLVFPPAVAGSGIQAANPPPSSDYRTKLSDGADVLLFAPAGVVDAGDAGISSTGNILVGALDFVGRDNVSGNVTVSVAGDTGVSLPSGMGSVGNDASQSADKAASNTGGDEKEKKKLAFLTIELLGTGKEADEEDEDEDEKKKKKKL